MITSFDKDGDYILIHYHMAGIGTVTYWTVGTMKRKPRWIREIGWFIMKVGLKIIAGKTRLSQRLKPYWRRTNDLDRH